MMSRNNDIFLQVRNALNERFGLEQSEYVDLGLPSGTLWATCNIGAKEPHETGLYFAWGETTGYSAEQVGKDKQFTKEDYVHLGDNSIYDSNGILKPKFDTATVNLGDEWRMPTKDEFEELLELENEWVENYNGTGVNGRLFVGYNGKTLFVPAVGFAYSGSTFSGSVSFVGYGGYYWSSSLHEGTERNAYYLDFGKDYQSKNDRSRHYGLSIRPVC